MFYSAMINNAINTTIMIAGLACSIYLAHPAIVEIVRLYRITNNPSYFITNVMLPLVMVAGFTAILTNKVVNCIVNYNK